MALSDELNRWIRERISAGKLPKQHCRVTWYGPGRQLACAACDQPIHSDEVEVECDLPTGGTINFHRQCYEIWSTEWPACDV